MKRLLIPPGVLALTLLPVLPAGASNKPKILLYGNAKPALNAPTIGTVGIAEQSAPIVKGNSTLYVAAVWNRSPKTERVAIAGTAKLVGAKRLVHTNGQGSSPTIVPPNGVAFAEVTFAQRLPRSAAVKINVITTAPSTATVNRNTPVTPVLTVDSATVTIAGTLTGSVTNPGPARVTPASLQIYCFIGGSFSSIHYGYATGTVLTPGATASYTIPINARCTTYLVSAD